MNKHTRQLGKTSTRTKCKVNARNSKEMGYMKRLRPIDQLRLEPMVQKEPRQTVNFAASTDRVRLKTRRLLLKLLLQMLVIETLKKPSMKFVKRGNMIPRLHCTRLIVILVVISHSHQRPSRTYPTVGSKFYLEPNLHLMMRV